MRPQDGQGIFDYAAQLELRLTRQRRLIRWLSLTYGENLPVFHGPDRHELLETYTEALAEDDGDPAFWAATQIAMSRPEPGPPQDWGDTPVEHVMVDGRGNTVFDPIGHPASPPNVNEQ